MATSKKEKKTVKARSTIDVMRLNDEKKEEDENIQESYNAAIVLMPELEELVKKNPNRLIGCGG